MDRRDITVLRGSLKSKVEFVITLPISNVQRDAYSKYVKVLLGDDGIRERSQVEMFAWLAVLTLLMNHPLAFRRKLLTPLKTTAKRRKPSMQNPDSGSSTPLATAATAADDDEDASDIDDAIRTLRMSEETIAHLIEGIPEDVDPELSPKMQVLMEILALSKTCGDKVLVFSSSIPTLDYMDELLKRNKMRFGRIDGQVPIPQRTQIVDEFNQDESDLMLLSTKAGVGLNIQGANRVVIVDFGFNPSHELQAIGRSYRLGQTKPVFVYRLKCGGTFEMNVHNKQLFKQSLSLRVVDKKHPQRNAPRDTRDWLQEPRDVLQDGLQQWVGKDPSVMDKIIHRMNSESGLEKLIRGISTMETLQEEDELDQLTAEESLEVNAEYEHDLARAEGRPTALDVNGFPHRPDLASYTAGIRAQASRPIIPSSSAPQPPQRNHLPPSGTFPPLSRAHPPAPPSSVPVRHPPTPSIPGPLKFYNTTPQSDSQQQPSPSAGSTSRPSNIVRLRTLPQSSPAVSSAARASNFETLQTHPQSSPVASSAGRSSAAATLPTQPQSVPAAGSATQPSYIARLPILPRATSNGITPPRPKSGGRDAPPTQ